MLVSPRVLVYGGRGALGTQCIKYFKAKGWWVFSVDLAPSDLAHSNCVIKLNASLPAQAEVVRKALKAEMGDKAKLDAIFCVAGGWAGGNVASKEFLKNAELMWYQSVQSSLVAASLAPAFLNENGLLVLTGAESALKDTPSMIGYGVAKAAVHQLTKCFISERAGLPNGARAVAILPVMLDTPNNRKWLPTADFSTWTPLADITKILEGWLDNKASYPKSGSLVTVVTKEGKTELFIQ